MNKIYTTVWCESRQQWVVTSELATGSGRPKLTPKKSALAILLGAVLLPSGPVMATDYVGETVTGVQFIKSGDTATSTTINSGGGQLINGGSANVTTINNGGLQSVYDGVATSTTIQGGLSSSPVAARPLTLLLTMGCNTSTVAAKPLLQTSIAFILFRTSTAAEWPPRPLSTTVLRLSQVAVLPVIPPSQAEVLSSFTANQSTPLSTISEPSTV
ncbi:TPA: hypothetical protein QIX40_002982 [Enterobacter roggenkampii]|nr:hypothetical protein [Enterobacter roggenkampii]